MLIELLTKQYPGMRLWLSQRITAVFMAVYIVAMGLLLAISAPAGYEAWHALVSPWWWRLATLLFFMSLFFHAWLGVSDVLKDYIFNKSLRPYLQFLVEVLLIIYLVWTGTILWNI